MNVLVIAKRKFCSTGRQTARLGTEHSARIVEWLSAWRKAILAEILCFTSAEIV